MSELRSEQLSLELVGLSQQVMLEPLRAKSTVSVLDANSEITTVALELCMRRQMRLPTRLATELPLTELKSLVRTALANPVLKASLQQELSELFTQLDTEMMRVWIYCRESAFE